MLKSSRTSRIGAIKDGFKWILIFILDRLSRQYLSSGHRRMAIFSFDYVSNFITVKGVYEGEELDFLFDYLSETKPDIFNGIALDIGANIGNHALYFAKPFSRVICFEPNPIVFDVLAINAKMAGNVSARNIALSDQVGEGTLRFDPANLGSGSLFDPGDAHVSNVSLETLDSLGSDVDDVRLIKIDVQGAETNVIRGGRELIATSMPIILFEQIANDIDRGTSPCIDLLREIGYEFAVINTKLFRPVRFRGKAALVTDILFDAIKPPVKTLEKVTAFEKQTYGFIVALPGTPVGA